MDKELYKMGAVVKTLVDKTFDYCNAPDLFVKKGTIGVICDHEYSDKGWVFVEFDMPEFIEEGGIPLGEYDFDEIEIIEPSHLKF